MNKKREPDADGWIDCIGLTPDDKEAVFGLELRYVEVLAVNFRHDMYTKVRLDGRTLVIVGDPRNALCFRQGGGPGGLH